MRNIIVTGGAGFTLFLYTPLAVNWVETQAPHKMPIQHPKVAL